MLGASPERGKVMNIPSNQHNADEVTDFGPWTIYVFTGYATKIIDVYYNDVFLTTLTAMIEDDAEAFTKSRLGWIAEEYAVEIAKIGVNA
jgi:hypothetical protein